VHPRVRVITDGGIRRVSFPDGVPTLADAGVVA
jgi:hypothetical protein